MFYMTSTSSNILYGKCIFTHSEAATGRCSFKIDALKNFAVFTKKSICVGSLFNKITGLQAYDFIKKRIQHRCFPVNVAKSFKNNYLEEHQWKTAYTSTSSSTNSFYWYFNIESQMNVNYFFCFFDLIMYFDYHQISNALMT